MKLRATILELYSRVIKSESTDKKIYLNGEGNLYPNEVERVINNSPTAKRAALMMAKFISGDGLKDEVQNVIVNTKKGYTAVDVISKIGLSLAYQYGAFIHVTYGLNEQGNIVKKSIDILDYLKCRISKEDDNDYPGKIYYKDHEKKGSYLSSSNKEVWFYPYNPDPLVVEEQIKKDFNDSQAKIKNKTEYNLIEGIQSYRGQVYYLNLSPYIYALSPVDSVYNDADSEYRISLYTNNETRTGFLGKTIFMFQGMDEEESKKMHKKIESLLGADNSGNTLVLEFDTSEDINNVMKIEQIKAQFDDKLFTETVTRLRKNILGAFNNIPEALVFAGEGSLFSVNDQTYLQMKKFYSEQTAFERSSVEKTMEMLGFPVKIKEIGSDDVRE